MFSFEQIFSPREDFICNLSVSICYNSQSCTKKCCIILRIDLSALCPWKQADTLPLVQALPPISMSPTSPQHGNTPLSFHSPTDVLGDQPDWQLSHQQQQGEAAILPSYAQVQQERKGQKAHSHPNQQHSGSTGAYTISNEEIHIAAMEGVKTSILKRLVSPINIQR